MTSNPTITNCITLEDAITTTEKLGAILNGKSYLDLQVNFAPYNGSFNVFVTGSDSEAEVLKMSLELLVGSIVG